MALLPRPRGEHAERLVCVHGDLWDQNVLRLPAAAAGGESETRLIDFKQSCLSSAVQDLCHCMCAEGECHCGAMAAECLPGGAEAVHGHLWADSGTRVSPG